MCANERTKEEKAKFESANCALTESKEKLKDAEARFLQLKSATSAQVAELEERLKVQREAINAKNHAIESLKAQSVEIKRHADARTSSARDEIDEVNAMMARNRKQFKAEVNRARYQLELTQKHVLSAKERAGALSQELARAEEERNVARVELDALRSSTSAFESDASGLREKVFALREEISTMEANHKCALDEVDATWKRALQYEMQESKSSMAHLVQSTGRKWR